MAGIIIEDSIAHRCDIQPVQLEPRRKSSRAVTTLFDLITSLAITSFLSYHIPGAAGQGTNVTCNSGFEWMCVQFQGPESVSGLVLALHPVQLPLQFLRLPTPTWIPLCHTAELLRQCDALSMQHSLVLHHVCMCNVPGWLTYSQNCANTYIEKYPENIPAGTAIPAWAYLDVRVNGTFDPAAAEALAAQNLPESSAAPALSTSPTTSGTTSGPSTAPGDTSDSSSKKSNAGAIAGGVVGALAGLALVGAAVFFPLRLRSSRSSAPSGGWARTVYSADPQSWEKSPVTSVSTHRFYNPNDPRTFPGQDPFVSRPLHASVAYSAGVASSNRDTVVTTQSPYRAVPEL